jgi:hypothetical protein
MDSYAESSHHRHRFSWPRNSQISRQKHAAGSKIEASVWVEARVFILRIKLEAPG